ncbi:flagellar basal body-associated FliL family protein [Georgenia yuyongxinii]|uniref:Flagellar protein FliL n=1 Tax=Georgenia yuyongxinii TaxID=2589797 RepID=A0A5B8C378_9MICO|nr:flagellar basal body-associated FliL family protein [Georgenia yuyongxinii]
MVEQRTVGRPVNVRGTPPQEPETRTSVTQQDQATRPRRGKGVLVSLAVVIVVLVAAAAFLLRPWESEAAAAPEQVELGLVVPVEPISINLADGHYLRLGFSIQLTKDATTELQVARALDLAIGVFSGKPLAEINDPALREELKTELVRQLSETFDGEVVDVYLTDYVTQ